jgi:hypothetical protein
VRIADELQVDCPVFYVDNVNEYWRARGPDSFSIRDVPSLAPPFPRMWIEWRNRSKDGEWWHEALNVVAEVVEDGWLLRLTAWYRLPHYRLPGNPWTPDHMPEWLLLISGDGSVLREVDESPSPETHSELTTFPALLAIGFMHCKNVRHVEHDPVFKSGKGWRAAKPSRVRHYTLEIDPMKETLRREGQSETLGLKQALHICRGHFKDYRQSGLFGKIKGIFWWDSAVRGSPEHGQVVKDYAVKAPTETIQ